MHVLAYCYHWSRESLLEIPMRERKIWYEIVLQQKKAEIDAVKGK